MMKLDEIILQEATEQFRRKGLKFTMNDIAVNLHIAKKTIYKIYPTKEDLLMALLEYGYEKIHAAKKEVIESDLPLREKIAKVLTAMPEQYTLLDFRELDGLQQRFPKVAAKLQDHLANDWEPTIRILQEGIDTGILRPFSIPVLRIIVTSSIQNFTSTGELTENEVGYQNALKELVEIIMNGIGA